MRRGDGPEVSGGGALPLPRIALFLVQSRMGTYEFELPAERLNPEGVTFVGRMSLGLPGERVLIDIAMNGPGSASSVGIVGLIVEHVDGVGTRVQFCWNESCLASEAEFQAFLDRESVIKPGCDFPITVFALAA